MYNEISHPVLRYQRKVNKVKKYSKRTKSIHKLNPFRRKVKISYRTFWQVRTWQRHQIMVLEKSGKYGRCQRNTLPRFYSILQSWSRAFGTGFRTPRTGPEPLNSPESKAATLAPGASKSCTIHWSLLWKTLFVLPGVSEIKSQKKIAL